LALDRLLEYLSRLVEIVAGVQHAIDLAAVLGPLLDFVVIALVRLERSAALRRAKCALLLRGTNGLRCRPSPRRGPWCFVRLSRFG
jgi:hypothetical protein